MLNLQQQNMHINSPRVNNPRDNIFRFKQFELSNSRSAMKIGTDGVLLGAWAQLPDGCISPRILDVGSGTGIVALMTAQRYSDAYIDCVEIDDSAFAECSDNVATSPFCHRVTVVHTDFLHYNPDIKYNLIVSNPPFFKDSLRAEWVQRSVARHEDSLPLVSLLPKASGMLADNGRVALILPVERDKDVLFEATLAGLTPCRICHVHTRRGKPSRRTLWEFSRCQHGPSQETEIFIQEEDGKYSAEYVSLLRDFYLAF